MGLYRYVPNKARLLEAMVEHVAAEYDYEEPAADWRVSLLSLVGQQRAIIARHPWLTDLASRHHPLGPATLAYVERAVSLFQDAGVPEESLLETVGLFNGLVTTLARAATTTEPATNDRAATRDRQQALLDLLATGNYPRFAALAQRELPPHLDLDEQFARLVERVIDGLA